MINKSVTMFEEESEELAWSVYWAQDRLHSCIAEGNLEDQAILDSLWSDFAHSLEGNARVLDLATGNGAVPYAMLSACENLHIDAIDQAEIEPAQFLTKAELLGSVNFHSKTNILDTSFKEKSFSAITSQFGIEYAGLTEACLTVMPLLKPAGRFQFIVHHTDSDILRTSKSKLIEIEQLVRSNGLIDTLLSVVRGDQVFTALENLGEEYLEGDYLRTKSISGQVFSGIEAISQKLNTNTQDAAAIAATLALRLNAERYRLLQMRKSAQSEREMKSLRNILKEQSVSVGVLRPLFVDPSNQDYILGWLFSGTKL